MYFGRVTGTVVCTVKVPAWRGHRLLLMQPTDPHGAPQGRATIEVVPERVANVPWLAILEGRRDVTLRDAKGAKETVGLLQPVVHGGDLGAPKLHDLGPDAAGKILRRRVEAERRCDELAVPFYVRVDGLAHGECRVYRVIQRMNDRIIGGYTIIARRR